MSQPRHGGLRYRKPLVVWNRTTTTLRPQLGPPGVDRGSFPAPQLAMREGLLLAAGPRFEFLSNDPMILV